MLDHRVYRAAFLPALVALFVVAFSLADPPRAQTTRLAPLAFDAARSFGVLQDLAERFPRRRPGSSDDTRLADRVAATFESTGFAKAAGVERESFGAETIDGDTDIENVVAERQGLSRHTIVVMAHRDAVRGPAAAELSGTAALLELARILADRDLAKTVVLASVSGGSGGFAGAREVAEGAPGPVDAVFVLGDLAGTRERRPFVIPWATGATPALYGLERTVQAALRRELGPNTGRTRASVQLLRRALPLTLGEQGIVNRAGLPAVLISNSSDRRPDADEPIRRQRFGGFGRATLRALTAALDAPGPDPFPSSDGIVALERLVPTWSIRLFVLALLLPALVAALDAFFRVRRRGLRIGAWSLWAGSYALPFLLAWLWARGIEAAGAVHALPAPTAGGALALDAAGWAAMASALVVLAAAGFWLRPLLVRRLGVGTRGPDLAAGPAAAATGLWLAVLVLAVWVFNPYAAAVLLPAAHAWLLVSTAEGRAGARPGAALAALAAGLAAPLLLVAFYAQAWGLGPAEGLWTAFGLIAGGVLGFDAALVASGFAGALFATIAVLRSRRRLQEATPEERIRTRGPRSYAGPGSLGGTESALRR